MLFLDKFTCNLNVFHYPFDKQNCSVSFAITSVSKKFVSFKEENVKFTGEAALNNYLAGNFEVKRMDDTTKPFGIIMVTFYYDFNIIRLNPSQLLTIFLFQNQPYPK